MGAEWDSLPETPRASGSPIHRRSLTMNSRARFALVAAGIISLLWGCENQTESPSLRVLPFEEAFELEREIELEQPLDTPIVLISGLDQDGEGRIVITDQTEAAVSLFDKEGSLVWRVGRRGEGPGEFRTPIKPRFDRQGRIHVPDRSFMRITVLSPEGDHVRDIPIEKPLTILDFDLMPNGNYLVGGFLLAGGDDVVFEIDSIGALVHQYLPLAEARPAGEPESPAWRYARMPFVGVGSDRILAAVSLLDSLWSISENSGEVSAVAVTPFGYEAPSAPDGPAGGFRWPPGLERADPSSCQPPCRQGFYGPALCSRSVFPRRFNHCRLPRQDR